MALCLTCALAQVASSQTGTTSGREETSAVSAIHVSPSTAPSGDAEMAERVRQEFRHAWDGYKQYAWGHDALKPLSKSYHDWYSVPLLMSPVDALDTMILMGMNDEAATTRAVHRQEPVIRPRHLCQEFRNHDPSAGRPAQQLPTTGDKRSARAGGRFGDTPVAGVQLSDGNALRVRQPQNWRSSRRANQPAEVGTLLIEFGTLSKLTGKPVYYEKAKRAVVELYNRRSPIGLVGSTINVKSGQWTDPVSHISGGIDSYYEYLLKSWLLFDDKDCERMWKSSVEAVNKYLADTTTTGFWYGQADMNTGARTGTELRSARRLLSGHARSFRRPRSRAQPGRLGLQDVDDLRHRTRGNQLQDDEDHRLEGLRIAAGDHRVGVLPPPLHPRSALSSKWGRPSSTAL